jgi:hypothetical protein
MPSLLFGKKSLDFMKKRFLIETTSPQELYNAIKSSTNGAMSTTIGNLSGRKSAIKEAKTPQMLIVRKS